jgi:chromosome segregation ATPase
MNQHTASESARLIQELREEIAKDQSEIKLEDPKLKRLEQEVAREKEALIKKEAEATYSHEHIDHLKQDLLHTEQEFKKIQLEIQQMGLNKH